MIGNLIPFLLHCSGGADIAWIRCKDSTHDLLSNALDEGFLLLMVWCALRLSIKGMLLIALVCAYIVVLAAFLLLEEVGVWGLACWHWAEGDCFGVDIEG